jgi:periplasmic protein TonB
MVDRRTQRRIAIRIVGAMFTILLILGFSWFVRTMMIAKTGKPDRQVQMVQIIRPPPPPPPEPPPPPPPPEKTEQALPKDEPEPTPDPQQAPANEPLGVDADGSAGGDAFGLAARRGGSDLVGGTGSSPFGWYEKRIADTIRERLSGIACAKAAKGSLSLHLVLDADGKFRQVQLATTTGNRQVDQCIDSALTSMPAMGDPPPPGMPAQVNIKIVSRI